MSELFSSYFCYECRSNINEEVTDGDSVICPKCGASLWISDDWEGDEDE